MRFLRNPIASGAFFGLLFCGAVLMLAGCGGGGKSDTNATRSAIVGVAVRASDQKPVSKTVVIARPYVCEAGMEDNCSFTKETSDAPRVTADSDGRFNFPLAPGRYYLMFEAPKEDCTGYTDGKFVDVYENQNTEASGQMTETSTCYY